MKTYSAVTAFVVCCMTAFAFAQKPESPTGLADLLPIGTKVLIVDEADSVAIHALGEGGIESVKNLGNLFGAKASFAMEADPRFAAEFEMMKQSLAPSITYELTSVSSDHFFFKAAGDKISGWKAIPFTSIKFINHP